MIAFLFACALFLSDLDFAWATILDNHPGAHISAVRLEEFKSRGFSVNDIGRKFEFRIVNVDRVGGRYDVLTLSCPQLEQWRIENGFSPKVHGHDFHLTFGMTA